MRKFEVSKILLAICLLVSPFFGYAASLGHLNVSSVFGEPLKAEVELFLDTPEELATLSASIASASAYAQQDIPRLGIHDSIYVDVVKNKEGSTFLKLHSKQAVSEPYLDILIQVDWAAGRLQREYTVLLDEAESDFELTSANVFTLASDDELTATEKSVPFAPQVANSQRSPVASMSSDLSREPIQPMVKEHEKLEAENTHGQEPTKIGDTLIGIANQTKIEGVSLNQLLVGLYQNNKEAFEADNMNRLKMGQIIKVPSKQVLAGIGELEAQKIIRAHSSQWNAYQANLAAHAGIAKNAPQKNQSTANKIEHATSPVASSKAGAQDVIKLSTGEQSASKHVKNSRSAKEKAMAAKDEAVAGEKALKEAGTKVVELEKQIADMQKLLAMKNQSMADAEDHASESEVLKFLSKLKKSLDLLVMGGVALIIAGLVYFRGAQKKKNSTPLNNHLTSSELAHASSADFDLNIDVPQLNAGLSDDESDLQPAIENQDAVSEMPEVKFDLSSIDLNLADTESELPSQPPELSELAMEDFTDLQTVAIENLPELKTVVTEDLPEIDVKLDLALAYIDMDDKEGAREILEEIIKEGGSQQQARAQQLFDSLA